MTAAATALRARPEPPPAMLEQFAHDAFQPAPDVGVFVISTLLNEDSPLYNADHAHLAAAEIAFLWTNVPNRRQQKAIAGTAEIPRPPTGNAWSKARYWIQMREWFGWAGDDIDFLITIDANWAAQCSDVHFMALIDHELYHCAQAEDEFGLPKFKKDGLPVFAMMGHDVEEFVGVVRRYGAQAGAGMTRELVEAANNEPEIAEANVRAICGACR